jgi:hypothetical protein
MTALDPYPSAEEREQRLEELARLAGGEVLTYGESVKGRPLRAAKLPSPDPDAPRLLCTANIHGPELISCVVALAWLRSAGEAGTRSSGLRERAELWVIPCLNPDGFARTFEAAGQGRLVELRPNENGVDLNRNFPAPPGERVVNLPWAGSSRRGSVNYRGPNALSEPETEALDRLLRERRFHASVNLHSFMGTVIPPRVRDRSHYETYGRLAARLGDAQRRHRYRRLASRWLDVFTGELEDHQHHALGCWAVCVEIMTLAFSYRQHLRAPSLFWRFNPRDPQPWIENDLPGIAAFFEAALDLPAVD